MNYFNCECNELNNSANLAWVSCSCVVSWSVCFLRLEHQKQLSFFNCMSLRKVRAVDREDKSILALASVAGTMEPEAPESVVFDRGGLDSIPLLGIEAHENTNLLFENLPMGSPADNDNEERIEMPENVDTFLKCFDPGSSDTISKDVNELFANANLKLGGFGSVSGGAVEDIDFQSWGLGLLKEGDVMPSEHTSFQGSPDGALEGSIEVPETATFHLRSRWLKQSPGGFLEGGFIALPLTCTRITISCKRPCYLHLPFYSGRTRDIHSHSYDCGVDCSRKFVDMEEEADVKGVVHSLQVEGTKLMYGSKEVAEVKTENNRHVVHLGGRSGNLRIAVIKPLTKQVDLSEKKNLEEEAKTTRICVKFYKDSVFLISAESKKLSASSDADGKKKRKIKHLASDDLDETVGIANTVKKRKTKDLAFSDLAGFPSQLPTFPNFSSDILSNSNLGDIFAFKEEQWYVPSNPLNTDEEGQGLDGLVENMDGGCVRADMLAEEAGILPKLLTETASVPNVFHEHAAMEKEVGVGLADVSSGSNFVSDVLINSPPYYQQGWSSTDGEVGEDSRLTNCLGEDEFDLEAIDNLLQVSHQASVQ